MTIPPEFFEQPWYRDAAKRSKMKRPARVYLKPPSFDNLAQIYRQANSADRRALEAKIADAPEPLRSRLLGAIK
jgi:hypothetical protein